MAGAKVPARFTMKFLKKKANAEVATAPAGPAEQIPDKIKGVLYKKSTPFQCLVLAVLLPSAV